MRLRGKIAIWFWAVFIFAEGAMIHGMVFPTENPVPLGLGLVTVNLIFLPIVIRNYVEIDQDTIRVVFGLAKDVMKISEITEIYQTFNPIASSAASLDRIVIRGRRQELMCSVRDKETLFRELKRLNPAIEIRSKKKKKKGEEGSAGHRGKA